MKTSNRVRRNGSAEAGARPSKKSQSTLPTLRDVLSRRVPVSALPRDLRMFDHADFWPSEAHVEIEEVRKFAELFRSHWREIFSAMLPLIEAYSILRHVPALRHECLGIQAMVEGFHLCRATEAAVWASDHDAKNEEAA
jgi:hypothetical protein